VSALPSVEAIQSITQITTANEHMRHIGIFLLATGSKRVLMGYAVRSTRVRVDHKPATRTSGILSRSCERSRSAKQSHLNLLEDGMSAPPQDMGYAFSLRSLPRVHKYRVPQDQPDKYPHRASLARGRAIPKGEPIS
jgi:hypothetical protein